MGQRIGGVAHQIHEHLDKLIAIPEHARQRRIEIFDESDVLGEARLGDAPHAVEHFVDVDRHARERTRIAERFHPVDQGADAIGFGADKLGQVAFVCRQMFFDQLRCAANAGQRILDLMRQHGRHAVHRTHRAPVEQLPVDALRQAAFLQHDDRRPFGFGQRRDDEIGDTFAVTRRRQIDDAFAD